MLSRKFPSFIEAFDNLVIPKGSPPEFARWTALWLLGAAVERRVWTFTKGEQLFPNLFVFLIGPPGWGKGLVLEPAHRILSMVGKNRIGAQSMTSASLVDGLRLGQRTMIDPKTQKSSDFHSLNILSPELQVLLPENNVAITGKATYLYDGKAYSETRRDEEKSFDLERCLLSMLGGTTTSHLFSTFPESAFSSGFFSRTVLVWGTIVGEPPDLFAAGSEETVIKYEKALGADLKAISETQGQFTWSPEAKEKINVFFRQHYPYGGDPVPSHPRLLHYCTRRTQHLVKLMMLRGIDLSQFALDGAIFDWAYDLLIGTEALMPEVFKEQNQGGEANLVADVHHELARIYLKTKKPIPRSILYQLLGARTQAYKIEPLINMAVTGGWLEVVHDKVVGKCYIPRAQLPSDEEVRLKKG